MEPHAQLAVLVVDDHELVRAGVRLMLEDNQQIERICEVSSGEEALKAASEEKFDIVLMDIKLPGMSGHEASDKMLKQSPDSRIIIITGELEAKLIRKLLGAGVRGYITKGSSVDEMNKAISKVIAGEQYLSPDVAQHMAMNLINGDDENSPFDLLTTREMEIVNLLLKGHRNRQISENLFISEKTVSTHRTRAFDKLKVKNAAELVRLAMRFDLWN